MRRFIMKPIGTIPLVFSYTLISGVFAPADEPGGKAGDISAPASAPVASPGLVNEWLREQSAAFQPWDFGGQFRLRYDVKENGGSSGRSAPNFDFRRTGVDNDNSFLLLREKVHIGYTPCSWFNIFAEGRDSSSTWDDRHPSPETDQFDLHQAFIRLGDASRFPLTAKIGRQELIYGDERVVGNAEWANVTRSFDAAKLRFENSSLWVDGFVGRVVLPVDDHFNEPNDYDWFSGVYASTASWIPKQETQLYFLSRNASAAAANTTPQALYGRPPSARDIYTLGTRIKSLPGQWHGWDYTTEIAGQLGSTVRTNDNRRLGHQALAASVGFGYTWANAWGTPHLGLEYNFSTGDHDPNDGKDETFDNLFPTNHKHYGYMDFIGWRNIHNPRLNATLKPAKGLQLNFDYHLFWLADTHDFFYPEAGSGRGAGVPAGTVGYGRNPQFNSFAGSETDLEAIYTIKTWAILRAGYGHFFVGDYVKSSLSKLGGATDADWVYVQTTFSF